MPNYSNETEFPNWFCSVEEIRNWLKENTDTKSLAVAFALADDKSSAVSFDVDDYEEGTEKYKKACQIEYEWFSLEEELKERIFDILRSEGVEIPETGQIEVLEPFMKRYGYFDGNGWWIRKNEE